MRQKLVFLIYPLLIGLALWAGFVALVPYRAIDTLEQVSYPSMRVGPKDAQDIIVAVIDYDCPYCHDMMRSLIDLQNLSPDIQIRYVPLPVIGSESSRLKSSIAWVAGGTDQFNTVHQFFANDTAAIAPNSRDDFLMRFDVKKSDYAHAMSTEDFLHRQISALQATEALFGDVRVPSLIINGHLYAPDTGVMPSVQELVSIIAQTGD